MGEDKEEGLFRVGKDAIHYKEAYRRANGNGILDLQNKIPFLQFPALERLGFLRHGFSTRLGGVSEGPFASMNLGFSRGDEPERVMENLRRICGAMRIPPESLVFSDQVHGKAVRRVGREDAMGGRLQDVAKGEKRLTGVDGLITDEPGVALVTSYADCVPLFFADPARRAIGLSHSGWRGTAARMGARTVEAMTEAFGTDPADLVCVIGPSICGDCYEVSEDVFRAFEKEFRKEQMAEIFREKEWAGGERKFLLDLWRANQLILSDAGVRRGNIYVAGICTCCNSGLLFSHRKLGGRRGSLQGFLMIRGEEERAG